MFHFSFRRSRKSITIWESNCSISQRKGSLLYKVKRYCIILNSEYFKQPEDENKEDCRNWRNALMKPFNDYLSIEVLRSGSKSWLNCSYLCRQNFQLGKAKRNNRAHCGAYAKWKVFSQLVFTCCCNFIHVLVIMILHHGYALVLMLVIVSFKQLVLTFFALKTECLSDWVIIFIFIILILIHYSLFLQR